MSVVRIGPPPTAVIDTAHSAHPLSLKKRSACGYWAEALPALPRRNVPAAHAFPRHSAPPQDRTSPTRGACASCDARTGAFLWRATPPTFTSSFAPHHKRPPCPPKLMLRRSSVFCPSDPPLICSTPEPTRDAQVHISCISSPLPWRQPDFAAPNGAETPPRRTSTNQRSYRCTPWASVISAELTLQDPAVQRRRLNELQHLYGHRSLQPALVPDSNCPLHTTPLRPIQRRPSPSFAQLRRYEQDAHTYDPVGDDKLHRYSAR